MSSIRRLGVDDLPRLRQFWIDHGSDEEMITRGNIYRPEHLEGFVIEDANEWIGLLTFFFDLRRQAYVPKTSLPHQLS